MKRLRIGRLVAAVGVLLALLAGVLWLIRRPVSPAEPAPALQALIEVLDNQAQFYSSDHDDYLFLDDLREWINQADDDLLLQFDRFALVDFDGDGLPELVLEMSYGSAGFFQVFRFWQDEVWGYQYVYRAMLGLQKDGTFTASGGAGDNRTCKLRFLGPYADFDEQFYVRSYLDEGHTYALYDMPISEQAYRELSSRNDDAVWHDFSLVAVRKQLSRLTVSPNPDYAAKQAYFDSLAYLLEQEAERSLDQGQDEQTRASLNYNYYLAWQAELDAIYALLHEGLSAAERSQLSMEQEQWRLNRDYLAGLVYDSWLTSNTYSNHAATARNDELAEITRRRTYRLIDLYFAL